MKSARQLDPNREALRQRLGALSKAFGIDTEFTAADVQKKATEFTGAGQYGRPEHRLPELFEAFTRDGQHVISIRSIGRQLKKDLDRVSSDGYHIELIVKDAHAGNAYKLVKEETEKQQGSTVSLEEAKKEESKVDLQVNLEKTGEEEPF
jgi:hypothetical protein